jgi:hypothetical protein
MGLTDCARTRRAPVVRALAAPSGCAFESRHTSSLRLSAKALAARNREKTDGALESMLNLIGSPEPDDYSAKRPAFRGQAKRTPASRPAREEIRKSHARVIISSICVLVRRAPQRDSTSEFRGTDGWGWSITEEAFAGHDAPVPCGLDRVEGNLCHPLVLVHGDQH